MRLQVIAAFVIFVSILLLCAATKPLEGGKGVKVEELRGAAKEKAEREVKP